MTGVSLCAELGYLYESRITVSERSDRKASVRSLIPGSGRHVASHLVAAASMRDPPYLRRRSSQRELTVACRSGILALCTRLRWMVRCGQEYFPMATAMSQAVTR